MSDPNWEALRVLFLLGNLTTEIETAHYKLLAEVQNKGQCPIWDVSWSWQKSLVFKRSIFYRARFNLVNPMYDVC